MPISFEPIFSLVFVMGGVILGLVAAFVLVAIYGFSWWLPFLPFLGGYIAGRVFDVLPER